MLGFAWMLRNEAAKFFGKPYVAPVYASTTVFCFMDDVVHFIRRERRYDWMAWSPSEQAAALALLTAHNAEPRELSRGETE